MEISFKFMQIHVNYLRNRLKNYGELASSLSRNAWCWCHFRPFMLQLTRRIRRKMSLWSLPQNNFHYRLWKREYTMPTRSAKHWSSTTAWDDLCSCECEGSSNERDICQLAYAKSFAKTTGTNSPDGHATIKPKWRNFEKSRWTVRQQWLVVTRPLDDCQTTFFRRFKQFGKFWKKSLKVTRQWSEVTRPLDDCQTTFF